MLREASTEMVQSYALELATGSVIRKQEKLIYYKINVQINV